MNRQQAETINLRLSIGISFFTLALAEIGMLMCYIRRIGPELATKGVRGRGDSVFYWLAMVLLVSPMLSEWFHSNELERTLKELGGDWFLINKQKKQIFNNLQGSISRFASASQ